MVQKRSFGQNLKFYRRQARLTQSDLASLAGADRTTIAHLEADRYEPSLRLAVALAKALNQTLNDLVQDDDDMSPAWPKASKPKKRGRPFQPKRRS